jgi:enoyl-[acyl-carrier-protein] reductase (NADH)
MDRPHSQLLSSVLAGRKGLIVGIANEHSIAYGCAGTFRDLGAELAVTEARERAPLRRPVELEDVGTFCAFLVSDAAKAITGDTHYVDGGLHILA